MGIQDTGWEPSGLVFVLEMHRRELVQAVRLKASTFPDRLWSKGSFFHCRGLGYRTARPALRNQDRVDLREIAAL